MTIPLKHWTPGSRLTAAELNRMVEAIKRATPVAGKGISVSQGLGGSVISLSGSGGSGISASGEIKPLTVKIESDALAVYAPLGCLQSVGLGENIVGSNIVPSGMTRTDETDWYYVGGTMPTAGNGVGVTIFIDLDSLEFYAKLANGPSEGEEAYARFSLGYIECTSDGTYNLVQNIYGPQLFLFGGAGGGGGGSVVDISEQSGVADEAFVTFGGMSQGVASLIVKDGVASDAVIMPGDSGTVVDYLAGILDYTDDPDFGALGVNITSENLGSSLTPDETPSPNTAAPSAHTHTLSQLVGPSGEEMTAEDLIGFFSNIGMWDDLDVTGEGPSENSLLCVGDIEDDETYLKPDSAVPSAGSMADGDLLILSGHQHPLNVADEVMATGATGEEPTPPPAGDYIQPVGVGEGPSGEASPTTAMFGTDPHYARTDHVHPICDDMGPTGAGTTGEVGPSGGVDESMPDGSGDIGGQGQTLPTGIVLDDTTWTPGESGYVESYCCRVAKGSSALSKYAIFRRRKISRTGAVVWVGPEYIGFEFAG